MRFAVDQLLQRAEDGRRDGSGGDDRGVDGGDAVTDQPNPGAVDHDVVAAREQEKFVSPGLEEDEPEQRSGERHGRPLDGQRSITGFLHGIGQVA